MYIKTDLKCIEIPYRFTTNNIEFTVTVLNHPVPHFHIVGVYRSKIVKISHLILALTHLYNSVLMEPTIPTESVFLVTDKGDKQLIKVSLTPNFFLFIFKKNT